MRITPSLCRLTVLHGQMQKSLDNLAYYSDGKVFVMAGIELGKIKQLGEEIAHLCQWGSDLLFLDSQENK